MKRILILILLLLPLRYAYSQYSITVDLVGLENNKGLAIVALLDQNERDIKDISSRIRDSACTVIFKDIKPGQYAVRFIHDENENEKLDTNMLGIPKEGFGFSNDAMGKFGPKDFSEWLFKVSGNTKISLSANYMF